MSECEIWSKNRLYKTVSTLKFSRFMDYIKNQFHFTSNTSYSRLGHNKDVLHTFNVKYPGIINSVNELAFWIRNYKEIKFISKQFCHCGKRTKYDPHGFYNKCCSRECNNVSKERILKTKKSCIKRFGTPNPIGNSKIQAKSKRTKLERYGDSNYINSDKAKETWLAKYGVDNPMKSPGIKKKFDKSIKDTYGVDNIMQSDFGQAQYKKSFKKKYGVTNPSMLKEITDKIYFTKKENNSFKGCYSNEEDEIYNLLKRHFKVERQYKSELYPFNCDFYLRDYDIYIEYHGFWTHGNIFYRGNFIGPYSSRKILHQELEYKWLKKKSKMYKDALKVWTIDDVNKRKVAKRNNINLLEFWNFEEVKEWIREMKNV